MHPIPVLTDSYCCFLDQAYASRSPRQNMDVFVPRIVGEGEQLPMIIDVHGGGWEAGDKGDLGAGKFLVQAGYIYAKIAYRRSCEEPWPACIEDVKTAIRFLRSHAKQFGGDENRIALTGHSAGSHLGMIAALCADTGIWTTRDHAGVSERVQAVVSQAGVVDLWRRYLRHYEDRGFRAEEERKIGRLLGGPVSEEALRPLSVMEHVATSRYEVPHFFVNADKDKLATLGDTNALAAMMRARHWMVEQHCIPEADHVDPRFWQEENLGRVIDFLGRVLKPEPALAA